MSDPLKCLRTCILNAIGNEIGTYTINGTQVPAIHVVPPAVPNSNRVDGLEVIISRSPSIRQSPKLNARTIIRQQFSVFLIQHARVVKI